MFKIDRAADLAGLSRDERFKREHDLYESLTDAQKKMYDDMAAEDKKRHALEMELYKEGKYVPGKIPYPEAKKDVEMKEEEKAPVEKAPKKKAPVEEKEPTKEKKTKAKSSSSSDSFDLGDESDD